MESLIQCTKKNQDLLADVLIKEICLHTPLTIIVETKWGEWTVILTKLHLRENLVRVIGDEELKKEIELIGIVHQRN